MGEITRVLFATALLVAVAGIVTQNAAAAEPDPARRERWEGLRVKSAHPRIWLDDDRLEKLQARFAGTDAAQLRQMAGRGPEGLAFVYAVKGDADAGAEAIAAVRKLMEGSATSWTVPAALVYDWCHPLLSDDDKAFIGGKLVEAGRENIAFARVWRSFHNGLYSHGWRLTATALALQGDDPFADEAVDFLKDELEDALKTFERLFPDGEWPESFDYNRHVTYDALRIFTAIKSATGVDFLSDSIHMRNTTLSILYASKPNGLVCPGDDNDWPFVGMWEHEALAILADQYDDPYAQYYLNHCPWENFRFPSGMNWKTLLWYDPERPERTPDDLPLSRIFRGDGLVIARSSWEWDSAERRAPVTWASFRCGDYFGDHAHFDNGHFDIYYRGELALDSGRYDDDWGLETGDDVRERSQFFNYYRRTIAHNTILVYDPDEEFTINIVNDGGQLDLLYKDGARNVPEDYEQGTFPSDDGVGTCDWATNPGRWETGDMLAYRATDDFTYACGDATKSYSDQKLERFVRQFVFVQPDIFIVFDRVVSKRPEFKKTWLLHSAGEPLVSEDGARFEVVNGEGRLVVVSVLPEEREVSVIGGPGDEFLVGGIHYKCGPESLGRPSPLHYGETPGAWRVEHSPAAPAGEDFFLHVMAVTDRDSDAVPAVEVLANDAKAIKLRVAAESGAEAVITFGKSSEPACHLSLARDGRVVFEGDLPNEVSPEYGRSR